MPEPSGRRTSITTMSGWKRRACSMASATVPASATTWNPSRRSSNATRPWRTTSWSSTTRRRSGWGARSATVSSLRLRRRRALLGLPRVTRGRRDDDDDTRAIAVGPSEAKRPAQGHGPVAHVAHALVPAVGVRARQRGRVEAPPVVLDREDQPPILVEQDEPGPRRAGVAGDVRERLTRDEQDVRLAVGRQGPKQRRAAVEVDLEVDDGVHPELFDEPCERLDRVLLPAHRWSQPQDVGADVSDHEVQRVDRAV